MKKKTGAKILIIIFTAFIAVMGMLYIFMPKTEFSETEKRYLMSAPKLTLSNIKDGSFSEDFETFLADQTPMRTLYVSINAYFELLKGNNGSNGAYLGRDGYIIEKPFERENLLQTNLRSITEFSESISQPVSLVAVPSKGYVCGDKLPKNAMKYLDGEYNKIIKESAGNIKTVDVTAEFMNSADKDGFYYKTDHHWTSLGAYTAYRAICREYGLTPEEKSDFKIETAEGFYGTSYAKACYTLAKPDSVELWIGKNSLGKADVTITEGKKESASDSMFFREHLKEGDKYLTFLDGNHSLVTVKTGNTGGRLLMIKDSFAHCIAPFLAENFEEIVMVDLRYYKDSLKSLIDTEGITDVMFLYSIENLCTTKDIIFE